MNVTCPECRSVFRIDPAKVPESGARARCSVCGAVMPIEHANTLPAPSLDAARATAAPARPEAVSASAPAPEPSPESPQRPAVAARGEPAELTRSDATPGRDPATSPTVSARAVNAPAPGATPTPTFTSATTEPSTRVPDAAPVRATGAPSEARPRPVNPYLSNTPELRARRLARALVSDLVAYNPQKREQGLRDGTLRQLFRDEIRKSWDEYVEQVGANVAESTPHFQDALNDVLAGGQRVF